MIIMFLLSGIVRDLIHIHAFQRLSLDLAGFLNLVDEQLSMLEFIYKFNLYTIFYYSECII